jgi:cysteine desulfurase
MEIYLDHAATTKPRKTVINKMCEVYEEYGNPSSLHNKGIRAEKYIKEAKNILSKILKVEEKELYFTSGGTESNNLAIIGTAFANQRSGRHIITSSIEHASVSNTVKVLEEEFGFEVTKIKVNEAGIVDMNELENALREDTILVTLMHVNNEIGSVQPIEAIGTMIKKYNANTLFHVDAIQSFGKYILNPKRDKIDLLSISAHKIHGPKGVGLLYVRDKVKIKPIIYGGQHQHGLRSGTENVAGIAGLALASKEAYDNFEEKVQNLYTIKESFVKGVLDEVEDVTVNGDSIKDSAPHIVNMRFKNIRGEVLLHTLENKEIYVSTGSACSSHKFSHSETLKAIGLDYDGLDESVRFSFSYETTEEEIEKCIEVLKKEIPFLRRYIRGGR